MATSAEQFIVMFRVFLLTAVTLLAGLSVSVPAQGHDSVGEASAQDPHAMHRAQAAEAGSDPHARHRQQAAAAEGTSEAEVEVPAGLQLVNRFGENVDLRADVIGDRVVAVNFVYTSCTTVCPVTSSIFGLLQDRLESELGTEVALITITVDPARDSSHRMMSYAKNFSPQEGWSWLTGDKGSVDAALRAFGAYTPSFEDHPAMVLVGDAASGRWIRLYGFPAPEEIEQRVRQLLHARAS